MCHLDLQNTAAKLRLRRTVGTAWRGRREEGIATATRKPPLAKCDMFSLPT
jgi:hypothetical protein